MRRGRFELFYDAEGMSWYWRLVARNGEVLCHSEQYGSERAAEKGIRAARRAVFAFAPIRRRGRRPVRP